MTVLGFKFILALSLISTFCLATGVADTCSAPAPTQCIPGLPGRDGQPGPPGPSGLNGHNGRDGAVGTPGLQGPAGWNGTDGQQGPSGPQGPQGPIGEQGMKGDPGEPGPAGSDGTDGVDGAPGRNGTDGFPGPPGTLSDAVIAQLRQEILEEVRRELNLPCPGDREMHPATSCKAIYECDPTAPSGYYWIRNATGSAVQVFCLMNTTNCDDTTGGWMRAVYINMTDAANSCPQGLTTYTQSSTRFCGTGFSNGCTSVNFPTYGIPFTKVCGRALGYQYGHTDGFRGGAIDSHYVDGLSVTHGTPRNHIWTFATGLSKDYNNRGCCNCPCASPYPGDTAPAFVGEKYFCESGNTGTPENQWQLDDPLWDSQGCASGSTCCNRGGPWFTTTLSREVSDDIEVRWCVRIYEESGAEQLEIYIN